MTIANDFQLLTIPVKISEPTYDYERLLFVLLICFDKFYTAFSIHGIDPTHVSDRPFTLCRNKMDRLDMYIRQNVIRYALNSSRSRAITNVNTYCTIINFFSNRFFFIYFVCCFLNAIFDFWIFLLIFFNTSLYLTLHTFD